MNRKELDELLIILYMYRSDMLKYTTPENSDRTKQAAHRQIFIAENLIEEVKSMEPQ